MKFLIALTLLPCLLYSAGGQILVQDHFAGPGVDTNLWQIILPFSQSKVVQTNGWLTASGRGSLATKAGFDQPVVITGKMTHSHVYENFQVKLRSDLTVYASPFFELTGVSVIFSAADSKVYIQNLATNAAVILTAAPFTFQAGREYEFTITDSKTNVTVSVDGTNVTSAATTFATGSRVVIQSREFSYTATSLDYITISELFPTPVPCSTPSGLVSWWKAEGNADDSIGSNHGVLQSGLTFDAGKVGRAFSFDGINAFATVTASSSLNVGLAGEGLTVECWIKPAQVSSPMPLVEWDGTGDGTQLWIGDGGALFTNLKDASGVNHLLFTGPGLVNTNEFQHVGVTYDKASGAAGLYYNGSLVLSSNMGVFTPQTSYGLNLGKRTAFVTFYGALYRGLMDEVSVYSRGLMTNEMAAIYNAGSSGKCPPPEPPPACDLPVGIVSWWKAESNGMDSIGSNHGTLQNGTVFTSGRVGQSFAFDGNGDAVSLGNPESLRLQNFTIESWVKRGSATVATLAPAQTTASILVYGYGGYGLGLYNDGGVFLTRVGIDNVTIPKLITDTNWHHLAVAKNGTNVVFYVDGQAYPAPAPYLSTFTFTSNVAIGARGDNLGNGFLGLIDELSVYNRALGSNEIGAIYAAGSAGKCAPPEPPPACDLPEGIVSWWKAEGNGMDSVGTNTMVLNTGASFATGKVGEAFDFDGVQGFTRAGASPSLNVGAGGGFTVEAWINPDDTGNGHPIIEWNGGAGYNYGVHFWVGHPSRDPGYVYANIVTTSGNWMVVDTAPGAVVSGVYQHVALTYDKASGMARILVNGAVVGEKNLGTLNPQTSYPVYIGRRPPGDANSRLFAGAIDEVSIYNRALATSEIAAIYNAGSAGKCATQSPGFAYSGFSPDSCLNLVGAAATTNDLLRVTPAREGVIGAAWHCEKIAAANGFESRFRFRISDIGGWPNLPQTGGDGFGFIVQNVGPGAITTNVAMETGLETNSVCVTFNTFWNWPGIYDPEPGDNFIGVLVNQQWLATRDLTPLGINLSDGAVHTGEVIFDGAAIGVKVDGVLVLSNITSPVFQTAFDPAGQAWVGFGARGGAAWENHDILDWEMRVGQPTTLPPVITQQPASQTVIAGNPAALSIMASGATPRFYQWQFDGDDIAGATNNPLVLSNVQPAQAGNYSVMVSNAYGSVRSSNALLTVAPPASGWLVNVDFNVGTNSAKSGLAAIGQTASDYWNLYTRDDGQGGFRTYGEVSNLRLADGTPTGAKLTVANAPGAWGNGSTDPMYNVFLYPFNGGNITVVLSNLPAGTYDMYVYGADNSGIAGTDSNYEVKVGGTHYGNRTTSETYPVVNPPVWTEGQQYARYPEVVVGGGEAVELTVHPGVGKNLAVVSGLQLKGAPNPATLPAITQQPSNQSVIIGDAVSFSVTATGLPLSYQWRFNGDNLADATNSSLALPSAQIVQAGNYSVILSNAAGAVTSSNASLTVLLPECTPAPSSLVAWWPAEGNALDSVGAHPGTAMGNVAYGPGKVGQAFKFNGANSAVDMGNWFDYQTFTLSLWVNPGASQVQYADILDNFHNENKNWVLQQNSTAQNQYYFAIPRGSATTYSTFTLASNQWQHLVITRDTSNHNRVYVNGTLVAEAQDAGPVNYTGQFLRVGGHASNVRYWNGQLDELAVFDCALGTNEIAAIYAARGEGTCPLPPTVLAITPPGAFVNEGANVSFTATAAGSPPLAYQWQFNSGDLAGATNATLALSNVVFAQAGNYTVVVTGPGGTASSNAVLTVNRAPLAHAGATEKLLVSPNGSNAVAVLNASLSSDPDGDVLTYAWFRTGEDSPFTNGIVAITSLPVGTNLLTLKVDDGLASGSQNFAVEGITTSQAVDRLAQLVQSGSDNAQPLAASLRAALASIDRSQPAVAINQLEAFKNKVLAQVMPVDPVLANQLLADAQAIIDALNGGTIAEVSLEITSIKAGNNGKPHLNIRGNGQRIHVVEMSTNLVDWTPVGVASKCGDCDFEFEDGQSAATGARYYRVVSPR